MIYDRLDKAVLHTPGSPSLQRAFEFLKQLPPDLPDGRHDIDGDDLFALVISYRTTPAETRPFETHRKYIDLQVVLEGQERFDVTDARTLPVTQAYQAEKDVEFYAEFGPFASAVLQPGFFALVYPHEAHRPGCSLMADEAVRKLVIKIRV